MGLKELKKTDLMLSKISRKLNFLIINPVNIKSEQKRFFRNPSYNPQFKYQRNKNDFDKIMGQIQSITADNTLMGSIFETKKKDYIALANLLKSIGTGDFTRFSIGLYGSPDKKLLKKARSLLKVKMEKKEKKLTTQEIIELLKNTLDIYGLKWHIREKEMSASAAVLGSTKTVYIKKKELFSPMFLKRLIIHEIGTHVLRIENGSRQPFRIFKIGLPNYLMTEEGLAVVNEERYGSLNSSLLKNYAGRVLAVDAALKKSFSETYKKLRRNFSKNAAWKLTLRVKRGLRDTSLPGAFTKDYLYLKGYVELQKYLDSGGDIEKLYYGKVGIEHVHLLSKINGLKKPEYLPK